MIRALSPDPRFPTSNGPLASRRPIDRGLDGPTIRSTLPSALRKEFQWTLIIGPQQFTAVSEESKKILCETMGQHLATKNEQATCNAKRK